MVKKLLFTSILSVFSVLAFAQKVEVFIQSGQKKYNAGNFSEAAKDFSAAVKANQTETDSYLKKIGRAHV